MLGLQVLDTCLSFDVGAGVLGLYSKLFIHCIISPELTCGFWLHTQTYLMFPAPDGVVGSLFLKLL